MSGAPRQKETFSQAPVLLPITRHAEGHRVPPPSVQTPSFPGRRQLQVRCPPHPGSPAGRMRPHLMGLPHPLPVLAGITFTPGPGFSRGETKLPFFFQPMDECHGLCQNQTVPANELSLGEKIMRRDRKSWRNMLGFSGWKELGVVAYWP